MKKVMFATLAAAVISGPLAAQGFERRAALVGGGNPYEGRCTVEVVVDGAAEVDIRGDMGNLQDLSGRPAQWRRFECTGAMPPDPGDFRFRALEGRGRQELVRDPRNGGAAVVRIQDPEGGAQDYRFEIAWGGGRAGFGPGSWEPGGYEHRDGRRAAEAGFRSCEAAVRRRSGQIFGTPDIELQEIRRDPDGDRVAGTFYLRRDRDRDQPHRFYCSMDYDRDEVRQLLIDPNPGGYSGSADRWGNPASQAVEGCRAAVAERLGRAGYRGVEFERINVDNNPGRNDRVVGAARAHRGPGGEWIEFSCRVDLHSGRVRSVNVNRR